ncbi:MAG: trypsin-like peptidase domain-containing protein [Bacteroidota bacterium]
MKNKIIFFFLFLNFSFAQTKQDEISKSRKNAVTQSVEIISPTVVGINVIEVREYRDPLSDFFGNDPFFQNYFGNRRYKQEVKGLGSGVIISSDGYIITNDHVAGNAKTITVTLTSGEKLNAELIGSDQISDISLLKISGKNFPFAKMGNSDDIVIGEWVVAFGNPFGLFENIHQPIVTVGVVSAKGMNFSSRERNYRGLIQTDAVINSGNSGGPLVNSDGEIIGINTLIYTAGVSNAYIGYGFAIPVNKVKKIVDGLKMRGMIERNFWTGLEVHNVDERIAKYFGLEKAGGTIVSDVQKGSPSEKAGIKISDIILEVNGENILTDENLLSLLNDANPGDKWKMKIFRDKKIIEIILTIQRHEI